MTGSSTDSRPVAVVSGGSRGLGLALVRFLLDSGYRVATFSRSETDELAQLRAEDPGETRISWAPVDATATEELDGFVRDVVGRFGRVDALVNNAGVGLEGLLSLTRPPDIERALSVNLLAPILLARACLKPMLVRGSGCIVNVSSINGIRGQTGVAADSAAKAALDGLTRSLAREVGPAGVRVVAVAPGYFDSQMVGSLSDDQRRRIARRTPLGRLGSTDDVVGVIGFLLSDAAGFVTGQTIVVDGGFTC